MLIANDICARFLPFPQVPAKRWSRQHDDKKGYTLEALRSQGGRRKNHLLTHYEGSPGAKLADVVQMYSAEESPLDSGSIPIEGGAAVRGRGMPVLRPTTDAPERHGCTGPHQRSAGGEDAVREGPADPQLSRKKTNDPKPVTPAEIGSGSFGLSECRW